MSRSADREKFGLEENASSLGCPRRATVSFTLDGCSVRVGQSQRMRRGFMMKTIGVVAVWLLVTGSVSSAEEVWMSPKGKKVLLHSQVELSPAQKKDARKFRNVDFFAAMAINTVNRTYEATGAAHGYHDLKLAQETALRSCRYKAASPSDCTLYMSVVPGNFDQRSKTLSLSEHASEIYGDLLKWSKWNTNGYRALAISERRAFGWSGREKRRERAVSTALEKCEKAVEKTLASGSSRPEGWRKFVFGGKRPVCRVVSVFGSE